MSDPLVRGHCNAIRHCGPFVIGEDFSPPAHPGRIIWRVDLSTPVLKELEKCIWPRKVDSSDGQLVSAQLTLANGVRDALKSYVSDCQFQVDERAVRIQIKKLEQSILKFVKTLPAEHDALGYFIYETYTGEVFIRDTLKPDESTLIRLQSIWREGVGFDAIKEQLQIMQDYVAAAGKCLGKSKPLEHRKATLVRALADIWNELTGEWPTSGRNPRTLRQIGPFARFVRIACSVLHDPLSPEPLDAAIRKTCERKDRS